MIIIQKSGSLGSQEDDVCFFCLYINIITALTVIGRMTLTCLTSINIERAIFYKQNLRIDPFMLTLRIQVACVVSANVE